MTSKIPLLNYAALKLKLSIKAHAGIAIGFQAVLGPCVGQGDGWFSCGTVCDVEPSKRTIDIVRFECARTFADQAAAVNHGLEVARKWVDENAESFRQSSRRWIGRTPCPCKRSGSN